MAFKFTEWVVYKHWCVLPLQNVSCANVRICCDGAGLSFFKYWVCEFLSLKKPSLLLLKDLKLNGDNGMKKSIA